MKFYEDQWHLLKLTPKKEVLFIIGDWDAKAISQEMPRIIGKFGFRVQHKTGQNANKILSREHTGHRKHPFQPHKRWLYTWISPNGQNQNKIDYIISSQRQRTPIWSAQTRPGADSDSDHQFLTAKFRFKLKNVGRTTRPFRHDLNQIPHDYAVEVMNRFKGSDLDSA